MQPFARKIHFYTKDNDKTAVKKDPCSNLGPTRKNGCETRILFSTLCMLEEIARGHFEILLCVSAFHFHVDYYPGFLLYQGFKGSSRNMFGKRTT